MMTDKAKALAYRMRNVFDDTPEIASWYETSEDDYNYSFAETRDHLLCMWKTMKDGARMIEAQVAEIERLRFQLEVALETLLEEGVCGDDCNACKEARASLGEADK
jgi:hypothetical protein